MSKILILLLLLVIASPESSSLDFWQYPEIADKNALFVGGFAASLSIDFSESFSFADNFSFYYPELFLDYVLPIGLPFSFGVSVRNLEPDLFGFGIRPGYHINVNDENLDVYILYVVSFVSTEPFGLLEWGGRFGLRRRFGGVFLSIETGWRLQVIYFGLSLKIN